jgi:hypothetical protein
MTREKRKKARMSADQTTAIEKKLVAAKQVKVGAAGAAVLAVLSLGLLACGGGGSDSDDSPATTQRTKNMPLNSCVSVMSGGRPSPGVTIPRCIPTTLPGNPSKPKKG